MASSGQRLLWSSLHLCALWMCGNTQFLLYFCSLVSLFAAPQMDYSPLCDANMSGTPLIALWPSGICILTAHELQRTEKPTATYPDPAPPASTFCSCFTLSLSFGLVLFRQLSRCFLPSLFHSVCSLDPARCTPSSLIKACIINPAISLSIPLPRSHDCYIMCKLFGSNSLLMSLL